MQSRRHTSHEIAAQQPRETHRVQVTPPLDLDDRQWAELTHAYGPAADVPALLRQLRQFPPATDYRAEPYFSLWSALCHQGDVYPASYAAVPHLVAALLESTSPQYDSPLQLIVCIEIARAAGKGPEVPVALAAPYWEALRRLPEIVRAMTGVACDEERCLIAAAALAVANGHARLAEAMLELEPAMLDDFLGWVRAR
jgi:hypothetical protein